VSLVHILWPERGRRVPSVELPGEEAATAAVLSQDRQRRRQDDGQQRALQRAFQRYGGTPGAVPTELFVCPHRAAETAKIARAKDGELCRPCS
jgi:hypothetical protein